MTWRILIAAAMVVAGCDGLLNDADTGPTEPEAATASPSPAAPAQPEVEVVDSEIDWSAARADFASRTDREAGDVTIQSAAGAPPKVPVLLPSGIVIPQSATRGPMIRELPDGYFASYPGARYDIVLNGTSEVELVEGKPRGERDDAPRFTATAAGAQVALSRYGADYLIEFECNEIDAETGTCIDEAEALSVAEGLVVARTR